MALNFNLQRAEQCLLIHLKAPKNFILVGEARKGHDKLLRNAQQQEESTQFRAGLRYRRPR